MRFGMFFLGVCLLSAPTAWAETDFETLQSTHFEIFYEGSVDKDFVDEVIGFAEKYYDELTGKLGFVRYDYWTWDDRAKIYIFADQESYVKGSKGPEWSGGCADYQNKTIWTFPRGAGFFDALLPHEIGHIIFHEVIGSHSVPAWFEEGVASYLEPAKRFGSSKMVLDAKEKGTFIPLEELNGMSPHALADPAQIELFYAESVSLLTFMIDEFGIDRFNSICDKIKEGKSFETAIKMCLFGVQDIGDLAWMWEDALKKKGGLTRRTML